MALSPLNRRRFERFKANRRGWWSLWLFLILFGLSLGAELIANDKPIAVRYDGQWYFPAFKRYPETTFGGEFPLEANYKSPYIRELLAKKDSFVLWAPIPFSYQSINYDLRVPAPAPPSADNWLSGHQPRLPGGIRHPVHLHPARAGGETDRRPDLHLGRSAHRLCQPGALTWPCPPSTAGASSVSRPTAVAGGRCGCS
jgi:hypothetical protein